MPTEVFVSHSHADQPFAEQLVGVLRHHRIPYWYSDTHIGGGQQWHDEIGNALQRCDWFILILSPDSVGSLWVRRELLYALQQHRFEGRIAPLLYRACDYEQLSWTLPQLQIIDFQRQFRRRVPRAASNLERAVRPRSLSCVREGRRPALLRRRMSERRLA